MLSIIIDTLLLIAVVILISKCKSSKQDIDTLHQQAQDAEDESVDKN